MSEEIKKETNKPIITISIGKKDCKDIDYKSISIPYDDYMKLTDDLKKNLTKKEKRE